MELIPEIVPISDLRAQQNAILERLAEHPVVLTQHGRAAAVLVHPEQWNRLVETAEDLSDALEALEVKARIGAGEELVYEWDEAQESPDAASA